MNELLLNILSVVVTAVVIPLITLLGTKLIQWVGAKIKNEKAAQLLSNASMVVLNAVKTVFQTYVESLKKSGNFTVEAQKEALNRAKSICLSQLSAETTSFIQSNFGNIDAWLSVQIEATINTLKN